MAEHKVYFISGMDTDCGKTYITARLAAHLNAIGIKTITQKPVQTGCTDVSEDIEEHRKVMGTGWLPEDKEGRTCTYLFRMPASPLLAAKRENRTIDTQKIAADTQYLASRYDRVLVEGAGGLMVPMTEGMMTIDFVESQKLPLILVASSRLGSINHTLLSVEACLQRGISLHTLVYNRMPADNRIMADDTWETIAGYVRAKSPDTQVIDFAECGFGGSSF